MAGEILLTVDGPIARVTLSQPDKLNAMTRDMWLQFREVWATVSANDAVRCVLLTGAGRGFCPGNDIGEFERDRSTAEKARALSAVMNAGREAMLACPHIVVARIDGACVGGGLEIAAMADMRIASARSRFGAPLNRLGLSMAYEEMLPIWHLTTRATMVEMLVEGRIFDAGEAKARGLVNRVVADTQLDLDVDETVARIVAGPPLVHRWHKRFFNRLQEGSPLTQADHDEHYLAFDTEDYRIGWTSFLAKTKPEFVGR
jgi:enoyl-CoA hydratase/carnithine racemase